jgi:hypothetical protein
MGWEQRGPKQYYYRGVRHGRRVTKLYLGPGLIGELAAELDAEERAERQAKAEAWQQARKDMEALDAQFTAWWNASSTLIDAYLTATGYYRHKRGPWRKRADPQRHPAAHHEGEQGESAGLRDPAYPDGPCRRGLETYG